MQVIWKLKKKQLSSVRTLFPIPGICGSGTRIPTTPIPGLDIFMLFFVFIIDRCFGRALMGVLTHVRVNFHQFWTCGYDSKQCLSGASALCYRSCSYKNKIFLINLHVVSDNDTNRPDDAAVLGFSCCFEQRFLRVKFLQNFFFRKTLLSNFLFNSSSIKKRLIKSRLRFNGYEHTKIRKM